MFAKLKLLYWRYFKSPIEQARHLGVNIGKNCFISTRNWGTEPYLITIGDHVQVTSNVHFNTHGGAHVARRYDPTFDCFGKIVVKDHAYIGSNSHILPGVTIGEGSLIAAGSIVCKSVPDNELWGGAQQSAFVLSMSSLNEMNRIILKLMVCRYKRRSTCCSAHPTRNSYTNSIIAD